jgi:hypothetical protein
MDFYELDEPRYRTDKEWMESLVCDSEASEYLALPAIICPECRATWSQRGMKLVVDDPLDDSLRLMLQEGPVPLTTYRQTARELRKALQLLPSVVLVPGMRIGSLAVKVSNVAKLWDFNWLTSGEVVITQRVVDVLASTNLTGYEVYPVRVVDIGVPAQSCPTLYELAITGDGGPMANEAGVKLAYECPECGRREYEIVYYGQSGGYRFQGLYVDPSRWDGADLFTFEDWPTIIMITEITRSVLSSADLSNWQAYSAPLGARNW